MSMTVKIIPNIVILEGFSKKVNKFLYMITLILPPIISFIRIYILNYEYKSLFTT